jgi:hypothetical protein
MISSPKKGVGKIKSFSQLLNSFGNCRFWFPAMGGSMTRQGRSKVETAGTAAHRRGLQLGENAGLGRKMPVPA